MKDIDTESANTVERLEANVNLLSLSTIPSKLLSGNKELYEVAAIAGLAIVGTVALARTPRLARVEMELAESTLLGNKVVKTALNSCPEPGMTALKELTIQPKSKPAHFFDLNLSEVPASRADQSRRILDDVLPKNLRRTVASRSPMYDIELAKSFRVDVERAFPNLEQRLLQAIAQRDQSKLGMSKAGRHWDDPFRRKFMDAETSLAGLVRDAEEAIQPAYSRVARDLGFPAPKFQISETLPSRGRYEYGRNAAITGTKTLAEPGAFFSTGYHELTHAEQANMVTRRLADNLELPSHANKIQFEAFANAWSALAGKERYFAGTSINDRCFQGMAKEYLREVLALRNGQKLSGARADRAEELLQSMSGNDHGPYNRTLQKYLSVNQVDSRIGNHLLYRAKLHELEALETGNLVQDLGPSVVASKYGLKRAAGTAS